ncbi:MULTISPECIES: NAD(P)-dependent oxidoreductase [unclassified Curtobacterium]|uniref:NAD-dependent epimerase/dehydratase family protein n=1 Tax=unclassified Curtobacterium TaxID=257496 RepID=UPI000DA83E5B|nr:MULTISPECIES: NAD-dependent epimerase/dehydratase family protein [unclassified Curtobacterium]PZE24738.1 NAD-dependent dehydratase [Curtobacterium sp. MCBD17_028]PZF56674.1 NAD-dependent dehydratase [Curtobacterium sp. MCBD17_034]PZM33293.1 NAD-dependent dehydratase [Curtobacterium sp. MCBD17_031]
MTDGTTASRPHGEHLLVTGGAGFIGSEIVRRAVAAGYTVRVLDSFRPDVHGDPTGLVEELDALGVEVVRGDVRDADAVDAALVGIDVVCHQAAKVGLGVDFQDAPDYVSSNDVGTASVLAAMDRAGVDRFVVASSMVVYGEGAYRTSSGDPARPPARRREDLDAGRFEPIGPDGHPLVPELIDESAALDPRNVYAQTKAAQEHLASSWARATGGRAIALRYHNVYGPGMPANTPYAGVASLFRSAIARGEAPRVFEDGGQRRDFVHVADVADANIAAIAATRTASPDSFAAYNVGSGHVHTIGDMAAAIAGPDGPQPVVTGEYRLGDVRHVTASSARIARELGWSAQVEFVAGMREFASAPLRAAVPRDTTPSTTDAATVSTEASAVPTDATAGTSEDDQGGSEEPPIDLPARTE